jgi:hypothetical protein
MFSFSISLSYFSNLVAPAAKSLAFFKSVLSVDTSFYALVNYVFIKLVSFNPEAAKSFLTFANAMSESIFCLLANLSTSCLTLVAYSLSIDSLISAST